MILDNRLEKPGHGTGANMADGITQTQWEEEMSVRILGFVRNELYLDLRFMDVALSGLLWKCDNTIDTMAVDGRFLYYSTAQLIRVFKSNPGFLNRLYLHGVLHCIYGHPWLCSGRNQVLWDVACDIIVEYVADSLGTPGLKRPLSYIRQQVYEKIKEAGKPVSAPVIYNRLLSMAGDGIERLQMEFYTDSHKYWQREEKLSYAAENLQNKWDKISRQSQMELESRGSEKQDGAEVFEEQAKVAKGQRDYGEFLRKFAVCREELKCDPDEFDLNYYTYGLNLYGNMPLIEPLETQETKKIHEFVIAIDTSYSTNGEIVKNFLKETYNILSGTDSFFKDCRIRIIQCDDEVRLDMEIDSEERLMRLPVDFHLAGGGGTDFRPVFRYVDELIERGELKNLGGLVYFTDGKGVYPKKRPAYKTAFIFIGDYDETAVPSWAMRMRLYAEYLSGQLKDGNYNGYKKS